MEDSFHYRTEWLIRKFFPRDGKTSEELYLDWLAGRTYPDEFALIDGNILLNVGIGEAWDLICGLGTPTQYSNANAEIGVGDSNTAEDAAHTGLQAGVNTLWQAMEAGYPSRTNQTVTFRSVFGSSDANYDWNEFAVRNGAVAGVLLNRKVSAQGTKVSGQTWTIDLSITLS